MNNIFLILFSELETAGGGRETWLQTIIPTLAGKNPHMIIHIISVKSSNIKTSRINFKEKNVCIHPIRIPQNKNKFTSIVRLAIFCLTTLKILFKYNSYNNLIFAIGSFNEVIPLFIFKLFSRESNYIVWLRGIWGKEIAFRHWNIVIWLISIIERLMLKHASALIANGADTLEYYGNYNSNCFLIPNCVDVNRFRKFNKHTGPCKISYIGRLSREKGIRSFLDAINIYYQKYPYCSDINFDIVGTGPELTYVQNKLNQYRWKNVKLVSAISNERMPEYLASVTATAHLTYSGKVGGGGVSNMLLEAMAAETICICWNSPIFNQVLAENECIYIPEDDTLALSRAFEQICSGNLNSEEILKLSSKRVNEYSVQGHLDKLSAIINES